MKLIILISGLFLVQAQPLLELEPSPYLIHLDRHNFYTALKDTSKPWFILVCRQFTPECEKVWPTWEKVGKLYQSEFHIAELGGTMNTETTRRLSAGPSPTFFFSQDGFHFIDYYWPREFQDLVDFMKGGYKRIPMHRYRTLQAQTASLYFYESALKLLKTLEREVDDWTDRIGAPAIPFAVKVGLLSAVVFGLVLVLCYQIYLCIYEPLGPEFSFKRKLD